MKAAQAVINKICSTLTSSEAFANSSKFYLLHDEVTREFNELVDVLRKTKSDAEAVITNNGDGPDIDVKHASSQATSLSKHHALLTKMLTTVTKKL